MAKLDFSKPTNDGKVLKAMGDALIGRFKSFQTDMHVWCVSAALHYIKHGDYTEIPRVLDGLGEGFKAKAVRDWMTVTKKELGGTLGLRFIPKSKEAGTPAHFEADTDRRDDLKARYEADEAAFEALLFSVQPWTKFDKEKEYEGFNFKAELAKLVKRASSVAADEKKKNHPKTNLDGLGDVLALSTRRERHAPTMVPTDDDSSNEPGSPADVRPTLQ